MTSLQGFTSLGPSVDVRRPAGDSDSVLILCTWMGASPKLIGRYASRYAEELPKATIILVTSSVGGFMFRSASQWSTTLARAVDELLAHPEKPIRAAAYSNGGVQSLAHLAEAYRARTKQPLALQRSLIDSAPGSDALAAGHRALLLSLNPPGPFRLLFSAIIWTVLGAIWLIVKLLNTENPIERLRRRINDPALFAASGQRIYMYSATDQLVPIASVESSASEAEAKGWSVKREVFVGSGHVAHAVQEPDRYWGIVRGLAEA